MMFERVLVATDFSAGSESALRVATRPAKLADAELNDRSRVEGPHGARNRAPRTIRHRDRAEE